MPAKSSKGRKAVIIVLTVFISIIILAVLIIGGITVHEATPHRVHFNKVLLVSNNKYDGKYLYHLSNNSGKVFILRTETDLRNIFKASGEDEFDLGEQDLTVKATGIETYRTDLSGLSISYPTIVYEYVSE